MRKIENPYLYFASTSTTSGNHIGDVCDLDFDGDGIINRQDNCPNNPSKHVANMEQHFIVALDYKVQAKNCAWATAKQGTEIRQQAYSNCTSAFIGEVLR